MSPQRKQKRKLKYLSLCVGIMWNLKCVIIPVTTGAIGVITQGLKKYLQAIQRGKNSINPVQKAAFLGTLHVKRSVL